jgi:hypothetical protein
LFWTPRVLAIAFIVFLSLFATDVFDEHLGFWATLGALSIHLIPVFVLTGILIAAWRWEWVGAVFYSAAGLLYVIWVMFMAHRILTIATRLSWIALIAGPAFLIAGLFLTGWLKRSDIQADAH